MRLGGRREGARAGGGGLSRQAGADYEYEPPLTITSTDKPVPQAGPTSTTLPPRAPAWLRGEAR